MEKKKSLIIICLFVIIAVLAVLCGLLATGAISFSKDKCANEQTINNSNGESSNKEDNDYKVDLSRLNDYKNVSDNNYGDIFKFYYNADVNKVISVSANGRVCIKNETDKECNYIQNLNNVIQAVEIPGHPIGATYYFLQNDGTVYSYDIRNNSNLQANKLNFENIKYIYGYEYENMVGGTYQVIGINNNGETLIIK